MSIEVAFRVFVSLRCRAFAISRKALQWHENASFHTMKFILL